ncbi:hypothetical protein CR105_09615 [Massilia eurypsychrophila]|jgi:hypothetical protein|uniref:DUF4382 domain-containing protein n=1 Tax=Massilia eurypsychrophila TaxID=1485217 RepID=A0A2G8TH81_9BURK|nr:DUF4382 domain-containing protein [Massilia eurypsychrophila]PIL45411.1 hypothetical protein CR105_09615 [Massilia eurypsychrophila]
MRKNVIRTGLLATTAIAAATLVACGGGGGGGGTPAPTPTATMGTLAVSMTDAPACGFDAVNVTVNKVRVHQSSTAGDTDAGWTDITLSPAKKINLLNLTNGVLESLGQTSLAPGKYTQLRLVLDANTGTGLANSVIPTGSTAEQTLETPSGTQSGIKLVNEFDIAAGQKVDLVLDFDACKSVLTRGNGKYALKPVIKVVPAAANGISGFVSTALLPSRVMVSAQQNGVIVSSTAPTSTGEFFLSRLAPGNYDVVITADDRAASVIGAVPVASTTSTTALSTSAAPIALAASASGSISGAVTLAPASSTEAAFVAAKQTFAAGPTVTIKYQGADLASGAYTLAKLPVAAPQYAAYGATLPLVFAQSLTTVPGAGKYKLDASATGYAVKSIAVVDIATANQSNVNFALAP